MCASASADIFLLLNIFEYVKFDCTSVGCVTARKPLTGKERVSARQTRSLDSYLEDRKDCGPSDVSDHISTEKQKVCQRKV